MHAYDKDEEEPKPRATKPAPGLPSLAPSASLRPQTTPAAEAWPVPHGSERVKYK